MTTNQSNRHGCLTAFLLFMLIMNSLTLAYYLFAGDQIATAFPDAPSWIVYVFGAACALNIYLTISLFRWKKWAFYAFFVVAGSIFILNVSIGVPAVPALLGLTGPLILYGVLQIGGDRRGWHQLK